MKYCTKCGAQMQDNDPYCPKCGWMQQGASPNGAPSQETKHQKEGIMTANRILLIIKCATLCLILVAAIVCTAFSAVWLDSIKQMVQESGDEYAGFINLVYWALSTFGIISLWLGALPLAWVLPMTVHYFKKSKASEPTTVAFKICTLIFAHLLVGVFMLCFEDSVEDRQ